MRQLVICSLVLLIGLPVIGFCQEEVLVCPYAGKCHQQAKLGLRTAKKSCADAKKCCADATACKAKKATAQVAATACKCKAGACKTATACKATACESTTCEATATACQGDKTPCQVAANACSDDSSCCQKSKLAATCCGDDERIKHLQKAAKHLQAAGLEPEAKQVLAAAHTLCDELLKQKVAELKRLKAEVLAIEHTASQLQPSNTRK